MALPTPILLLLLLSHSSTATNILLTDEILPTNSQLSAGNAAFIIHGDCNLALYNPALRFQSNTGDLHAVNCTLTLTDRGQLLILSPTNSTVWSSSPPTPTTNLFAALLRPDGHLAVYGPSLWSTPNRRTDAPNFSPIKGRFESAVLSKIIRRNHMFSSQVLNVNSMLASGDHKLVMKEDCSLEVVKEEEEVVWESGTKGKGRNCFARLDQRGQLAVVDDSFNVVWASKAGDVDGFYVLVVQNDGKAVIYGSAIWSTAS